MAVSARRRNESSDDEDEDQSYSSNLLSFSLPAGDFERFMLVKHRGKYLERLPMQASFVSWNVSGQLPTGRLTSLFESSVRPPDLVVVALQHVPLPVLTTQILQAVGSVAKSILPSSATSASASSSTASSSSSTYTPISAAPPSASADPDAAWRFALLQSLGLDEYTEVACSSFATLLTCVFVHQRHARHVQRVSDCKVKCGPSALAAGLGPMAMSSPVKPSSLSQASSSSASAIASAVPPNASSSSSTVAGYGALGIRFQLYQSTFCVLNSHLALRDSDVALRNSDAAHVCRTMRFDIRAPSERDADLARKRRQQEDESLFEKLQRKIDQVHLGGQDLDLELDTIADNDDPRPDGDDLLFEAQKETQRKQKPKIGGAAANDADVDDDDDDDDDDEENDDPDEALDATISKTDLVAKQKRRQERLLRRQQQKQLQLQQQQQAGLNNGAPVLPASLLLPPNQLAAQMHSSSASSSSSTATSQPSNSTSSSSSSSTSYAPSSSPSSSSPFDDPNRRIASPADPLGRIDSGAPQLARALKGVFDHDHVIFMGGLNYRLDSPLAEVLPLVERRDIKRLLALDQLRQQRDAGKVLGEFVEAPIKFMPTHPIYSSSASSSSSLSSQYIAPPSSQSKAADQAPVVITLDSPLLQADTNVRSNASAGSAPSSTSSTKSSKRNKSKAQQLQPPSDPSMTPSSSAASSASSSSTGDDFDYRRGTASQVPSYPDRVLFTPHPYFQPIRYESIIDAPLSSSRLTPALPLPASLTLPSSSSSLSKSAAALASLPSGLSVSSHRPVRVLFTLEVRFVLDDEYSQQKRHAAHVLREWHRNLQARLEMMALADLCPRPERFLWRPPSLITRFAATAHRFAKAADRFATALVKATGDDEEANLRVLESRAREAGGPSSSSASSSGDVLTIPLDDHSGGGSALVTHADSVEQGLERLGQGVMGGVSGLVAMPLKQTKEEGTTGFFKGLGAGFLGLLAKPVAGVSDFAASTLRAVADDSMTGLVGATPLSLSMDAFIRTQAAAYIRHKPMLIPPHHVRKTALGGRLVQTPAQVQQHQQKLLNQLMQHTAKKNQEAAASASASSSKDPAEPPKPPSRLALALASAKAAAANGGDSTSSSSSSATLSPVMLHAMGLDTQKPHGLSMAKISAASTSDDLLTDDMLIEADEELKVEQVAAHEPIIACIQLHDNQYAAVLTPYRVLMFQLPSAYQEHPDEVSDNEGILNFGNDGDDDDGKSSSSSSSESDDGEYYRGPKKKKGQEDDDEEEYRDDGNDSDSGLAAFFKRSKAVLMPGSPLAVTKPHHRSKQEQRAYRRRHRHREAAILTSSKVVENLTVHNTSATYQNLKRIVQQRHEQETLAIQAKENARLREQASLAAAEATEKSNIRGCAVLCFESIMYIPTNYALPVPLDDAAAAANNSNCATPPSLAGHSVWLLYPNAPLTRLVSVQSAARYLNFSCVELNADRLRYERECALRDEAQRKYAQWQAEKEERRLKREEERKAKGKSSSSGGFFSSLFGRNKSADEDAEDEKNAPVVPKEPFKPIFEHQINHRVDCWSPHEATNAGKLLTAALQSLHILWKA